MRTYKPNKNNANGIVDLDDKAIMVALNVEHDAVVGYDARNRKYKSVPKLGTLL
jgi:hypothetical protein